MVLGARGVNGAFAVEHVTLVSDVEFADVTHQLRATVDYIVTTVATVVLTLSIVKWMTVQICYLYGRTGARGRLVL